MALRKMLRHSQQVILLRHKAGTAGANDDFSLFRLQQATYQGQQCGFAAARMDRQSRQIHREEQKKKDDEATGSPGPAGDRNN